MASYGPGYNFGCVIANGTIFDSRCGYFDVLRDIAMVAYL